MRLACSTISFPQERPDAAIARIAWAGYSAVELALPDADLPDAEQIRTRLREDELELVAIRAGTLPAAGGEEAMTRLTEIGRAAAFARTLDCGTVVLEPPTAGDITGVAESLKLLDRVLGSLSVDLCLVNRVGTVVAEPEDLEVLWTLGLPSRVGIALDPASAGLAGWDPLDLDLLPEVPRHVYLTDLGARGPVPTGEGTLELDQLASTLRNHDYGGALCLSLENADPWAVEPLAKELRETTEQWLR